MPAIPVRTGRPRSKTKRPALPHSLSSRLLVSLSPCLPAPCLLVSLSPCLPAPCLPVCLSFRIPQGSFSRPGENFLACKHRLHMPYSATTRFTKRATQWHVSCESRRGGLVLETKRERHGTVLCSSLGRENHWLGAACERTNRTGCHCRSGSMVGDNRGSKRGGVLALERLSKGTPDDRFLQGTFWPAW